VFIRFRVLDRCKKIKVGKNKRRPPKGFKTLRRLAFRHLVK
jgi:hypothetical protein